MLICSRIQEGFNGLKWGSLTSEHLDYKNAEVLFIGEKGMPVEGAHREAGEELEKLEDEDEDTVEQLKGGLRTLIVTRHRLHMLTREIQRRMRCSRSWMS